MKFLLNHTSAYDIEIEIRCSRSIGKPVSLDRLQAALDDERANGKRKTVITLLEREIKRQAKPIKDQA